MAATNQKQYRPRRVLQPGDSPGYRDDETMLRHLNDEVRRIETTKLGGADFDLTGIAEGDVLVAGTDKVLRPQQYVPDDFGVGLTSAPTARFQVRDNVVTLNFTDTASGGFHGLNAGKDASDGTHRTGLLISSGTAGHWEVSEDTDATLIIRSQLTPQVCIRIAADGTLSVSGAAIVSGNTTLEGSLEVSGSARVEGAATLASTLAVSGTMDVSGAATFDAAATVKGNLAVSGTAEVSGAATLDGAATVKGNLAVSGTAEVSGTATLDGDFAHKGSHFGAFSVTPALRPAAYTVSNASVLRSYDVSTVTLTQLANTLATLLADLKTLGFVQ